MSIELELIQRIKILPFYHGHNDPSRSMTAFLRHSARSANLTYRICRSYLARTPELKLPFGKKLRHTGHKRVLRIHAEHQFPHNIGAEICHISSEKDRVGEMLKSKDESPEIFNDQQGGGSDTGAGDGQGGNGHGDGDGRENDDGEYDGSQGGNSLQGLVFWCWWLWKRAHIRSHIAGGESCSDLMCIADGAVQRLGSDMKSLLTWCGEEMPSLMGPVIFVVFLIPFHYVILEIVGSAIAASLIYIFLGILGLVIIVLIAVILLVRWCRNHDQSDSGNDQAGST